MNGVWEKGVLGLVSLTFPIVALGGIATGKLEPGETYYIAVVSYYSDGPADFVLTTSVSKQSSSFSSAFFCNP